MKYQLNHVVSSDFETLKGANNAAGSIHSRLFSRF